MFFEQNLLAFLFISIAVAGLELNDLSLPYLAEDHKTFCVYHLSCKYHVTNYFRTAGKLQEMTTVELAKKRACMGTVQFLKAIKKIQTSQGHIFKMLCRNNPKCNLLRSSLKYASSDSQNERTQKTHVCLSFRCKIYES